MSNADATRRLQKTLTERFPLAFPADQEVIRPLKLGIFDDLMSRLGEEVDPKLLQRALAYQTNRAHYWLATLYGHGERIDLDGNPAGAVDEKAKTKAAAKLAQLDDHYKDESARRKRHIQTEKAVQLAKAQRRAELERRRKEKERRRKEHEARVLKAKARRERREKTTQASPPPAPAERSKVEIRDSLTARQKPEITINKRRTLTVKKPKK